MSGRIVTPFRHQDPEVQPAALFEFGTTYAPATAAEKALCTVLRNLQDIDTALLGVVGPGRPGGGLSTARQILREAILEVRQALPPGRNRWAGRPEEDPNRNEVDRAAWRAAR